MLPGGLLVWAARHVISTKQGMTLEVQKHHLVQIVVKDARVPMSTDPSGLDRDSRGFAAEHGWCMVWSQCVSFWMMVGDL